MGFVAPREKQVRPLLIRGAAVLSMDPAIGDRTRADILVSDGRIAAIEPSIAIADAEIIDASANIAMPGFVDGHRHMWQGLIRQTLPTEDFPGYVQRVMGGWGPAYSAEDAYLGTLVAALGALDAGITAVFDWSHIQLSRDHTAAAIQALRDAGIRAVFGFGMSPRQGQADQPWPMDLARLRKDEFAHDDQLLTLALATLSPEHVPDEMARAHFALAREMGAIVTVHSGSGKPGEIARFGREGLLGPDVNLVHCNGLDLEDWRAIADTGTSVVVTPAVELQMGLGIPPIQQARDVGVKPALGIDVETSTSGDMFTQMRSLYGLQRSRAFERMRSGEAIPAMMSIDEVLELATMAGAVSMRLDARIGSLSPGKEADLILLRTDMLNVAPVNDMRNAVALGMDARNVDTVIVGGRIVKRDGRMLGVDMPRLVAQLQDSRDRVFQAAAAAPVVQGWQKA